MMYCWMVAVCAINWDELYKARSTAPGITAQSLERVVTRNAVLATPPPPISELAVVQDSLGRIGAQVVAENTTTGEVGLVPQSMITPPPNVNTLAGIPVHQGNFTLFGMRMEDLQNRVKTLTTQVATATGASADAMAAALQPDLVLPHFNVDGSLQRARAVSRATDHGGELATLPAASRDSHYCAVALTDAQTHNIVSWASIQYAQNFHHAQMTQTGAHSDRIWFNVLFQMLHAMHAAQRHPFAFGEMSLARNFYIKDLKIDPNVARGYWKYRISGIDYYIPNFGYLVLMDSNYKDPDPSSSRDDDDRTRRIYRVVREAKDTPGDIDRKKDAVRRRNHENLRELLDKSFAEDFKHRNGIKPGPNVMTWIGTVAKSLSEPSTYLDDTGNRVTNVPVSPIAKDLELLFFKHCRQYMHNRIGKMLHVNERPYIREIDNGKYSDPSQRVFKRGQLLAWECSYDTWIWVLFVRIVNMKDDDIGTRTMAHVLTRTNPTDTEIVDRLVSLENLVPYASSEAVAQDFNPDEHRLAEDQLIETYDS
jgi:hypothetical protein